MTGKFLESSCSPSVFKDRKAARSLLLNLNPLPHPAALQALRVPLSALSFGGIKDKVAITTQVGWFGVALAWISPCNTPYTMGSLA